jgi:Rha family phage regulatory protein
MNKLINIKNEDGQLTVTSRQIAENFDREHKTVLDAIRNLTAENYAVKNLMIESNYEVRGKKYPEYLLTKDGFSLLVMGFTGARALEWKLKYIKAFNEMEQTLKSVQPQMSIELQSIFMLDKKTSITIKRLDNFENTMPLFNTECKELQLLVRKVATKLLGGYRSPAYQDRSTRTKVYKDIQGQLKREFDVERYESIKRVQLDTAKEILTAYSLPIYLLDDITLLNNQIELPFSDLT